MTPADHSFQADPFVPQYLKDIQHMPHRLTPLPPIPIFPAMAYLQDYLPQKRADEAHKKAMSLALLSMPAPAPPPRLGAVSTPTTPVSKPEQLPPLTPQTYHAHFVHLLRWELDAQAVQKENIILWKVGVRVLDWDEGTFALYVPSVRGDTEFGGRVGVGDLVHLREVVEVKEIRRDGREEKEYITGQGTGTAFEGRVTVVRKREGFIRTCRFTF